MLLFLLVSQNVAAQVGDRKEAPKHYIDAFSSMRIYPNADVALAGFAIGTLHRPFDACIHFAGEGFARFGRKDATPDAFTMLTAGGALGVLWGAGDENHWFGAGPMVDLGWARVDERDDFVSSAYLRGLLYWRLRKEYWVGIDLRTGHVIAPVTVDGIGIKGLFVGLGVGFAWGKDKSNQPVSASQSY